MQVEEGKGVAINPSPPSHTLIRAAPFEHFEIEYGLYTLVSFKCKSWEKKFFGPFTIRLLKIAFLSIF